MAVSQGIYESCRVVFTSNPFINTFLTMVFLKKSLVASSISDMDFICIWGWSSNCIPVKSIHRFLWVLTCGSGTLQGKKMCFLLWLLEDINFFKKLSCSETLVLPWLKHNLQMVKALQPDASQIWKFEENSAFPITLWQQLMEVAVKATFLYPFPL